MKVINDRVDPRGKWEELCQSNNGHDPHGTVGIVQCLQVGGLKLRDKRLGSRSDLHVQVKKKKLH